MDNDRLRTGDAVAPVEDDVAGAAPSRPLELPAPSRRTVAFVCIAIAIIALSLSALAARSSLTSLEVEAFRSVNGLPPSLNAVIWPLMQYGTFFTIPALATLALLFRRVGLALSMLVAGVGVYVVARLVKGAVERGRPAALLSDIAARETFSARSLGFPSGHAAVSAALTFIVWRHLGPRWGVPALIVAIIVMIGRMYVGAHLPLDLVGGAALGVIAAGIADLVAPPARRRST
jgi:undecaprenyl-diphosphatase